MSINIDGRGLPCPGPVIAVKKALENMNAGIVTILVDNNIAKENVTKFATAHGCGVSTTEEEANFLLTIHKGEILAGQASAGEKNVTSNMVYVFTQDTLGNGNRELGAVLMKSFMYTLLETKPLPKSLLFMNAGVLLTIQDSPVLEHLAKLTQLGVEILSCGTCLDYFEGKDKLAIGGITNMYTIVETMTTATKVITL